MTEASDGGRWGRGLGLGEKLGAEAGRGGGAGRTGRGCSVVCVIPYILSSRTFFELMQHSFVLEVTKT